MINWADILTELRASGWSLTKIARETGTSVQTLSNVQQGRTKEPGGNVAVQLHALHERVCGAKAA